MDTKTESKNTKLEECLNIIEKTYDIDEKTEFSLTSIDVKAQKNNTRLSAFSFLVPGGAFIANELNNHRNYISLFYTNKSLYIVKRTDEKNYSSHDKISLDSIISSTLNVKKQRVEIVLSDKSEIVLFLSEKGTETAKNSNKFEIITK